MASQSAARVGEGQMVELDLTHMLVSIALEVDRNHEVAPTAAGVFAGREPLRRKKETNKETKKCIKRSELVQS